MDLGQYIVLIFHIILLFYILLYISVMFYSFCGRGKRCSTTLSLSAGKTPVHHISFLIDDLINANTVPAEGITTSVGSKYTLM